MNEEYYYAIDGKRQGPVPFAGLRELAANEMLKDPLSFHELKDLTKTENPRHRLVRCPTLIATTLLLIGLQTVHADDALHEAIFHGTITEVKQLVTQGADVNSTNGIGGARPLMYAVALTNKAATTFLLENGADPNGTDFSGFFPLFEAAYRGQTQLCDVLVSAGAKVNEMAGPQGSTPLMAATDQNQLNAIDWLLNHNADVNLISVPRRFAEFFRKRAPGETNTSTSPWSDLKKNNPVRALHLAVLRANLGAAELLLNYKADTSLGDFEGFTPLHLAVQKTNLDMVRLLLKHGANPNLTSDLQPFPPLLDAPTTNIASLLIANGAMVNDMIGGVTTPLHWFANRNKLDMISLLLQNMAEPGKRDSDGRTPADCARSHHFDEAAILLENAANEGRDNKPVNEATLRKIMSIPGQQINKTGLFDGDWRSQNHAFVTNRIEFMPYQSAFLLWDTTIGRIKSISVSLTLQGRPAQGPDPYSTAQDVLIKRFGPSDIQDFNLDLMAKAEAEWQLPRMGVFLKRIPHTQPETVDYEVGVVAKDGEFVPKQIEGAFGYTLGSAVSQVFIRGGQPLKGGGVAVGIHAPKPHPLLGQYILCVTQRTGKIYSICGMSQGDGGQSADLFRKLLKEVRANYDWESCNYDKSGTVRLEKGDRSIVIEFKPGDSGTTSASIRFLDGKTLDDAVLESKGF